MALPVLATLTDLQARGVDVSDASRAQAALEDASAIIRAEARRTWVDGDGALTAVPDVIATLTAKVARRSLRNPEGMSQETAGPFSVSYSGGDVYLTGAERALITRSVAAGPLGTIRTEAPWSYPVDGVEDDGALL